MKTRITELFGIQHPIIQGGMHYVGLAEMAAAVSNAGGLGIITGLTQGTPDGLAAEIERCRTMTAKPFGVNLTFLPSVKPPDYPGFVRTIIDSGLTIIETAGNNPAQYLPVLKEAGIKVIHKCTSVRHALKAQTIGKEVKFQTFAAQKLPQNVQPAKNTNLGFDQTKMIIGILGISIYQ